MDQRKPQLRRVGVFSPDQQLNRAISEFERNTRDTTDELANKRQEIQTATRTHLQAYTAKFGETVMCDPSGAGFNVHLPSGSPRDAGRRVRIKNTTGSVNTLTILPGRGAKVDSGSSYSISGAVASVTLTYDGANWWAE